MREIRYQSLAGGFFAAAALLASIGILIGYSTISQFQPVTEKQVELIRSAEEIRYLDEVLTMSARMAAFTGDPDWEARYLAAEPKLDRAIAVGQQLGHLDDPLARISAANERLIELELKAFSLVKAKRRAEAVWLLLSQDYLDNKRVYSEGLNQFTTALEHEQRGIADSFRLKSLAAGALLVSMLIIIAYIVFRMYRIMARRLDLETTLGKVARRLVSPGAEHLSEDIKWTLELLVNESQAHSAWLIYRQNGAHPRLIRVWSHSAEALDETRIQRISLALRHAGVAEDGRLAIPPEFAGAANIGSGLGALAERKDRHEYLLCLLDAPGRKLDWGVQEHNLLLNINEIIVRAVESLDYERSLRELATTDGLTGLRNRRHFDARLDEEWRRFQDTRLPGALLMLDIDWFKKINDQYGHAAGDEVLIGVARMLREHMRADDIVGRVGGEEFAIVLPASSPQEARETAERLRQYIASTPIHTEAGDISISVSVGATLFGIDDSATASISKRADEALYTSKNAGRNCVTLKLP
jgi:diguanylate cyclase (GGDEF)-like protein